MDVQIRLGRSEDLPTLIQIQTAAIEVLGAPDYSDRELSAVIGSQRRARQSLDELFVVAEVESEMVGFASLSLSARAIWAMYVHPDWSRRGVGSKLLAAVEAIAIERRVRVLRVMSSLTGIGFYRSQGYCSVADTGFWSDHTWIPCHKMEKRLLPNRGIDPTQGLSWIVGLVLLVLGLSWGQSQQQSDRDLSFPPIHRQRR